MACRLYNQSEAGEGRSFYLGAACPILRRTPTARCTTDCCYFGKHAGSIVPSLAVAPALPIFATKERPSAMQFVYSHVCCLDVHKKNVVAFVLTPEGKEIKNFPTMTEDLVQMADWIFQKRCTHVAMESTGSCWKPIYNLLEMENLEVLSMPSISKTSPTQNRCQRCGMDRQSAPTRPDPRQFHPLP